ncbi:hypothetical protein A3G67_02185 [Candidatus Roizmanbacteria bacterium RIFCSPLOWO2_12_FULL_40_12]|uniref:Uncharacterized protein n=1 Tax=Candidatus Roizmanbacteria bacterium RIFCSPLOWO2_01_FULL_40_42 TaxID=1802066 RepID=A0A1F7J3P9_9BACT|nr:MAG: hypothetical protein A2779_01390 [Candidatus Roizmanbacteria bacterium RIFCSPHIGHO2_01_FULL_40_98]OGK29013.1 MAG: hypothetical protein A3C31_02030 [Candidatus Roizmanbacteria bacterium RIFCSPHIGHO2_02_FULL_40_53]OGK29990.1 MAG: hypothetical protein A2W49_00180 [Candidatus Roizmanbacteria bacterium RIFCSPHIGHO2_12_41_18]OGK37301.1 MAG: hypothetical protein A3E69_04330 [Candidatus Roizmanbacteria bacterium RIFCSPHIGHO2_12_FULL_40_130]OGK50243.1 MAG: hypothetical protein A3B50_00485 [Candi
MAHPERSDLVQHSWVAEYRTIAEEGALVLQREVLIRAKAAGASGSVAIFDNRGMMLAYQATGPNAYNQHMNIALAKGKSVLATHRSTSEQRDRMETKGQGALQFADTLGSLFKGGVAFFFDEDATEFAGALVFSGDKGEDKDEEFCRGALDGTGFYTDLPEREQEPDVKLR